jgi:rod shape determining protein RodA
VSYGYPSTLKRRTTGDVVSRATGGLAYLRSLDWILVGAGLLLSGIGALLVWSATRDKQIGFGNDPELYLKRHLLNLLIGLVLAFVVSRFDYRLLRAYTPILYVLSLLGLLFVLVKGQEIAGAKAWIELPAGFSIQPSEFAKIAIILGMAMVLAEKRDAEDVPRGIDIWLALLIGLIPMGLIMLQPDLGTVLVTACAVLGIIAVSGAPTRWLVGIVGGAAATVFVAVQAGLIKQYQVGRITSFVDPSSDPTSTGYNTVQARVAIGSGGLLGEGLFHGSQTQGGFVPKNNTDFVYSVAGEELGMLGAGGIVLLLAILIWRGIRIALRASDMFGRLVATGIVCWLAFQAFENIGMNLGIMPVTGVPLPMVSYGGTSMFATWIAIGLLLNVHIRSQD